MYNCFGFGNSYTKYINFVLVVHFSQTKQLKKELSVGGVPLFVKGLIIFILGKILVDQRHFLKANVKWNSTCAVFSVDHL